MKANYHTHTCRCGHAEGTDEQYVKAALSQKYDVLGISDHVPYPYRSGFTNPGVRMLLSQLDEYLGSIRKLKAKYAGQMEILAGFECEHFPQYMSWLSDMAQEKQLDYLILGNHYDETDETGMYFGLTSTAAQLRRYVDSTVKGIESGLFAYLAHPDLFLRRYRPFDENCRQAAKDLAAACAQVGLPMEYNVHDRYLAPMTNRTSYPHPEFFEIAAQAGVKIIIGIDAHEPEELSDPTQWDLAQRELKKYGDLFIDRIPLRTDK